MNQRFAIHPIPFGILATAFIVLCGASFAQQRDSSSLPRAEQLSPSGRGQSGGTVQAEQSLQIPASFPGCSLRLASLDSG